MNRLVPRDEREASVDRAADRLAYLVLSFGLLAIVAYRGIVLRQESWDLLALVVLGGVVGAAYRWRERVMSRRWELVLVGTIGVALVVATIIASVTRG
jgi:peptidoglycan/LPS O-acetylase OafA/YrhL